MLCLQGFSEVTLNRGDHESLMSKKKIPPTNFLILILEKYLTVMGLGSLNAATLASNLHVATDLSLCHALRKIDLEHHVRLIFLLHLFFFVVMFWVADFC